MKKNAAALDPAKMTTMLRAGVLAIEPEDIGLTRSACPRVWGVMMELGEAEVVVSLVALLDGSVSIYLSDGNGVLGCGLHPDVRLAAAKMLNIAAQTVDAGEPVASYPMPGDGHVRFYLLTDGGVVMIDGDRQQLNDGEFELAELYYAGHSVIDIVELLGAGVDLVDEMRLAESANKRQAHGDTTDGEILMTQQAAQELKVRGRRCRILPYVGNVVRRSQN